MALMTISSNSAHSNLRILESWVNILRPEHVLSLVSAILSQFDQLNPTEQAALKGIVDTKYPDLLAYAKGATLARVKRVTWQCALLLWNTQEFLDLSYQAFLSGDIEALFLNLDYLASLDQFDNVRGLFRYVYGELVSGSLDHLFPDSTKKNDFLLPFTIYAFRFGCDEEAYATVEMIAGKKIDPSDPAILEYRREIRTPWECEMGLVEVWNFFHKGSSRVVSQSLLRSLQHFIEDQINYLDQHDSIEPETLEYLQSMRDTSDESSISYTAEYWKNFFAVRFYYFLALAYKDAARAEFLIKSLEENPDVPEILANIAAEMSHDIVIDESNLPSLKFVLFRWFLLPLLHVYGWVEYAELHGRIYALLRKYDPENLADAVIDEHMIRTSVRLTHLSQFGIAEFYHPILESILADQWPIIQLSLLERVETWNPLKVVPGSSTIAYYILESIMLYGKRPSLDAKKVEQIREKLDMPPLIGMFFQRVYPEYFPSEK